MNSSNASTSKHGIGCFGNHRKINGYFIAFLNATTFQKISKTTNMFIKLVIGYFFIMVRIISFPNECDFVSMDFQVAINAIIGNICYPIFVPLNGDISVKRSVFYFCKRFKPFNALTMFCPEAFWIIDAFSIPLLISFLIE